MKNFKNVKLKFFRIKSSQKIKNYNFIKTTKFPNYSFISLLLKFSRHFNFIYSSDKNTIFRINFFIYKLKFVLKEKLISFYIKNYPITVVRNS